MYFLQQGCTTSTSWGPSTQIPEDFSINQHLCYSRLRMEDRNTGHLSSWVVWLGLQSWLAGIMFLCILLIHKLISSSCSVADHPPKSTFHRHRWCKSLLPVDSSFQLPRHSEYRTLNTWTVSHAGLIIIHFWPQGGVAEDDRKDQKEEWLFSVPWETCSAVSKGSCLDVPMSQIHIGLLVPVPSLTKFPY